ncbi:4a-hydroxytetrahydrobiopterin dehydratase [Dokdonella ginsengisoli]|uniref:Putative pterin-4-alpha-carbinolamine dehydratase n=1 Tax=Dokdonella ginsengisoli TaxID=363846 RepID=A0ABV9QYJ0_9GAMM
MTDLASLRTQHCQPRKGKDAGLSADDVRNTLAALPGWTADANGTQITKEFRFADYFRTMAFVNAVASIAHREDHHPDLEVHYDRCVVRYSTHDVGGLSLNDLICAAKVEDLRVPD